MSMPQARNDSAVESSDANYAYFALFAAVAAALAFLLRFATYPAGPPESWGQFGDFLGGIVNPVCGIVTAFLVVRTLRATRVEAADTRREMAEQSVSLSAQLALARRDSVAADVRRKLDGILAEWKEHISSARYVGVVGEAQPRAPQNVDMMLRELFANGSLERSVAAAARGDDPFRARPEWRARFGGAAKLLDELATACSEYEGIVGNSRLTNFYRQRVAGGLAILRHTGMLSEPTARLLAEVPGAENGQLTQA